MIFINHYLAAQDYFRISMVLRIVWIYCFLSAGFVSAQDATEIVRMADQRIKGKTAEAEMTVRVIRSAWSREMKMKTWTKGDDLAMVLVTAPARDKGTVYLKRKKEVWNWIPSIERSIKLPPSMMNQSWMGTDFTNDDLVKEASIVVDYFHKITGETTIDGRLCYQLELIPRPESTVVWGKVLLWIDKVDFLMLKAEYYDEEGELINRMTAGDIKILGGRLLPAVMEMTPVKKKGNKTVLTYTRITFDRPLDDSFFSTQNIRNVE